MKIHVVVLASVVAGCRLDRSVIAPPTGINAFDATPHSFCIVPHAIELTWDTLALATLSAVPPTSEIPGPERLSVANTGTMTTTVAGTSTFELGSGDLRSTTTVRRIEADGVTTLVCEIQCGATSCDATVPPGDFANEVVVRQVRATGAVRVQRAGGDSVTLVPGSTSGAYAGTALQGPWRLTTMLPPEMCDPTVAVPPAYIELQVGYGCP